MSNQGSLAAAKMDDNIGKFDSKKESSNLMAQIEASAQLGTNKESRLSADEEKDIVAPLENNHDMLKR